MDEFSCKAKQRHCIWLGCPLKGHCKQNFFHHRLMQRTFRTMVYIKDKHFHYLFHKDKTNKDSLLTLSVSLLIIYIIHVNFYNDLFTLHRQMGFLQEVSIATLKKLPIVTGMEICIRGMVLQNAFSR